jgi:acetyl-CoA acetyltransferase
VLALQLDPYCATQLWPDADSVAGSRRALYLSRAKKTERDLADVAVRSLRDAADNPHAVAKGKFDGREAARRALPHLSAARPRLPANSDGATAMVIASGDLARKLAKRPVWIRGIDHRIDPPALGVRDLTRAPSAEIAAKKAGVGHDKIDFAELDAPYTHQELILREALDLRSDVRSIRRAARCARARCSRAA